jgi:hypothetical protein
MTRFYRLEIIKVEPQAHFSTCPKEEILKLLED